MRDLYRSEWNAAGYTFVLAEKPQAAAQIAQALATQRPAQKRLSGVAFYEVDWKGEHLVIAPAVGHLFGVAQQKRGSGWPVFETTWKPLYEVDRTKARLRPWLAALKTLGESAESFISATDYDVEGSLIAYCVFKYALDAKLQSARRVKFSTLSRLELREAFSHPQPSLDYGLIEAGQARHELDWIFGINTSRALMAALRQAGLFEKLSAGRVQSPTLYELAKREVAIRSFTPTPYYTIEAMAEVNGGTLPVFYEKKKISTLREANQVVRDCHSKFGLVEQIHVSERRIPPPPPFSLGTLQREAYRHFGFSPSFTLRTAESLYLQALISYPRTDSQKLPASIGYKEILNGLARSRNYAPLIRDLIAEEPSLRPAQGPSEDPAHPAIYPTGSLPRTSLSNAEYRLFDLIVHRFLAVFSQPYVKQLIKIGIKVEKHSFLGYGSNLIEEGWLRYYRPYANVMEIALPHVVEGQDIYLKQVQYLEKYTEPPSHYNPSSLMRFMERQQIGTKATRGETIDTLLQRSYVKRDSMELTGLGWATVEALRRSFKELLSVELTRHFEEILGQIELGKMTREESLAEAVSFLKGVYERFANDSAQTSLELARAIRETRRNSRFLGKCPECKAGDLSILVSSRTGKRFVGCSSYFKGGCKYTAPLPQRGTLQPLQRSCSACGYPSIRVRYYRGRSWTLCINLNCPKKKTGGRSVGVSSLPAAS